MRTLALLSSALVIACAGSDPSGPPFNPLAGLEEAGRNDSSTTSGPPNQSTSGFFRGTVYGYEPGQGADTLSSAVRLANVAVAAYPRRPSAADPNAVGPLAASTATDVNGEFVLSELRGGEYAVTFTPPSGSRYRAAWTIGFAWEKSGEHPWWVMLAARD